MAAIFEWSESNGAGTVVTDGISNLNFGNVDAANLNPNTYPIIASTNSYEKDIRLKFTDTFTEISNMKFWKSVGAYKTGEAVKCDEVASYVQPVKTTSSRAVTPVLTSEPGAHNVHAEDGSDTIVAPGYTKYQCLQKQTTGSTPSGATNTLTFTFQYDEV